MGTGRLVINEDEVPVVKKVFELREQGLSMAKIATRLNDLGFTTRKGLKFYSQTVQRIIKHEKLYRGDYEDPAIL
nr:recombinase family protein [Priestia megaterium]